MPDEEIGEQTEQVEGETPTSDTEMPPDTTGGEPGEPEEAEEAKTGPKKRDGEWVPRRRVDELTAEKYQLRGEIDQLRREVEGLRQPPKEAVVQVPFPESHQFETTQDYHNAVNAYIQAAVSEGVMKIAPKLLEQTEAQKRERETIQRRWDAVRAGMEKHPVLRTAATDLPFLQAFGAVEDAADGDNFASILAHFYQNQDEMWRLRSLPPVAQAKEIARLEARLTAPPPGQRKKSGAPAPGQTLSGAGATKTKSEIEMSTEEYVRKRQREIDAQSAKARGG